MKNVQHEIHEISEWISVPFAHYQDVTVPIINKKIIENGHTHIFFRLNSGEFTSLPLRFYATQDFIATIDAQFRLKTVRIIWTNHELFTEIDSPPTIRIAIICIPTKIQKKYTSINYRNYEEVCTFFGITEE